MKKNWLIIALTIIIGIGIIIFTMYLIDMERMKHNYDVVFSTWGRKYTPAYKIPYEDNKEKDNVEITSNIVKIKNGKINNEEIIENFLKEVGSETIDEKKLIIQKFDSYDGYTEEVLKFIPYISKCKEDEEESAKESYEEFKKEQGMFTFKTGDYDHNITLEFNAFDYELKRKVEDGVVTFYLKANHTLVDGLQEQEICKYSLGSSNYKKEIDLNFYQRKDLGIKTISEFEDYDFNIFTYGGDVSFTFDTDMVYTFETALQENIVTADKILEQARIDSEYGICEEGFYSDGGSVEYLYDDYTILKYDTLDGRKDLVIGIKGQIINDVNDLIEEVSDIPYTFDAKIKEVKEYNGKNSILVDGLDTNDVNYKAEFWCSIRESTKLLDKENNKIEVIDLKEGQTASITYVGGVQETYPAQIGDVLKVQILD